MRMAAFRAFGLSEGIPGRFVERFNDCLDRESVKVQSEARTRECQATYDTPFVFAAEPMTSRPFHSRRGIPWSSRMTSSVLDSPAAWKPISRSGRCSYRNSALRTGPDRSSCRVIERQGWSQRRRPFGHEPPGTGLDETGRFATVGRNGVSQGHTESASAVRRA
ncbi:hypothetical protein OH77DRAFT_564159 [Trametes cingulata]|nr:hypothetical protein OH77DRAFT_564159 [Trametes cingulata]